MLVSWLLPELFKMLRGSGNTKCSLMLEREMYAELYFTWRTVCPSNLTEV